MEPNHSSSGRSFLLLLILFTLHLSSSTARYTITPSQPLAGNETLVSASGVFALGFFTPPNSDNQYVGLWYNQISDHAILWVANRQNPVTNSTTAVLSLTPDGRLTITGPNSTVIVWSSTNITATLTSPVAELLDNGNLVVKQDGDENSNNYAWQGFDHLTDTLMPGMKLGVDLTTGLNRTLVAWTSPSDPSPGPYYVYMETRGDPEAYFMRGSTLIWRSGAWDGAHLSSIPDMTMDNGFSFSFVNNASEVAFSYGYSNQTVVSRVLVNSTGYVQRALWLWDRNMWIFFRTVPKDQCDQMGACGAYGLCDSNNLPMCSCLPGFNLKNPVNWNLWDWHDGCTRQTPLDCKHRTDGFVPVSNVRLPQSANASVDMTLSLDECRTLCLKNCSCTAYADANISDDRSGCVMWVGQLLDIRNYVGFGQDLYVRLAAADLGWFQWKRMKRRGVSTLFSDQSSKEAEKNDLDLPLFGFGTIAAATDYFAAENKLGEGGFGPVYKGKLEESQEIAVKRLAMTSQQGTDEFKNEVMLIAKLQHRNLVRLLGYCIQGVERMLIYEYMPNKSLDAFLFDKEKSALLDWKTRYQIIIGITRGLLYLHHDSRFRIIHRDLKASNILLDKEMNPKISDFGMARIFGGDETDFNTRKVVGTYGYMSPEYAMAGTFSMKSDVFSFGVLVLEIISGRKNRGAYSFPPHLNLVAHVWSLWNEGKSLQIVHESMNDSFPPEEILKCVKVGLLCVQERPEDRPLMSSVVVMLGSATDIASLPQPNKPGFIASTDPPETHPPPSKKQESCTLNDITISLDGR